MKRTILSSILVTAFISGVVLPGFASAQNSSSNFINEPTLNNQTEENKKLQAQIELLLAQIKKLSAQVGGNTTYNLPTATKKDAYVWPKAGEKTETRSHVITDLTARIANAERQSVAVEWKTKKTTDAELRAFCSYPVNIFSKEDGKTYVCPSSGSVVLATYKNQKNNSTSIIPESLQYGNQITFLLYTSKNGKPTDKRGVSVAFDSYNTKNSSVDPVKVEVVGGKESYKPGETIKFSVKGTTKDGNIADPSNGLHVQSRMTTGTDGNGEPVRVDGVYQGFNAEYNYATKMWDVTMTAPSSVSKKFTAEGILYCSNTLAKCTDGVQIVDSFTFKIKR